MPSLKQPIRQRIFCHRGATVGAISPDDLSSQNQLPSQLESSLQQQQKQLQKQQKQQQNRDTPVVTLVSPVMANNQSSWNNTQPDDDNKQKGGGADKDKGCNAEQRDRLAKCQKSLEQLEFSLNNLLLNSSLAANRRRNQRRQERLFSDLVESIRNNRAKQRDKACRITKKQQEKKSTEKSAAFYNKLQDESRALWRAQHIGAKCEDTVDRYMLHVIVDKLGEIAYGVDTNGGGIDGQ